MVCRSKRVGCKMLLVWTIPPLCLIKLNFDGCALGNASELGIGGVIRDRHGTMLRAFSKLIGVGLAIAADILALLDGFIASQGFGSF